MRVLAVAVLAMISVSCKSTSGGHYGMRAAAFVVPTFEEDAEREDDGDDSASIDRVRDCVGDGNAGECVQRARSAKTLDFTAPRANIK
ncbi:MAG: hypothetical protein V4655_07115 [Bdellovibrionota bacterium]